MASNRDTKIADAFERDILMALRYCYYVKHTSILTDSEYDAMEAEYRDLYGDLPVGSDRPEDYTPAQRALALYLLFALCPVVPAVRKKSGSKQAEVDGEELL